MCHALVRTGQPVRGRSLATAARTYFEQAGDVLMTAECLGWEAGAAQMMQDPGALGLIEEALERCQSLEPVPSVTEARLLAILGHVRVSRHEYGKAIQAYEQAVSVGAAFPDLRRLSYVYGNLSLAHQEIGQYAQAVQYSRRAMNVFEILHDRLAITMVENNLACLLFKQGDTDAALRHAQTSLQMADELGMESGKAHVLMTLAELELAQDRFAAAEQYARAALDAARRARETVNEGESHVWLGRVAAAQGDDRRADDEFAIAFEKFDAGEATDWQARGHAVYAEILEARGDLVGANREMRKALAAVGMSPVTPQIATTAIA
jgi:tetratricopeptide (TPR) repeat protein